MLVSARSSVVPLAFAALLLAGCSLGQLKGGSSSSSSKDSSGRGISFGPTSDARKDLGNALNKLNTAYPYRLTETSTASANGQAAVSGGTRVVEFASADRTHAKWTNGPLGDTEIITIGDKQYSKLNNGNWTEGAPAGAARREGMGKRMREMLASAVKDVQYIGPETVNGVPCHAYNYAMEMDVSGQRWSGTGKAWIGAADGLPHQLDSEMTVSSYHQTSHLTYEYNVDFKIEKPVM